MGQAGAVLTHVVDHPLAADRLTRLRDQSTPRPDFRRALDELTQFVVYESLRDHPTEAFTVTTPLAPTTGYRLAEVPVLIPVMRAGLGMLRAALDMIPEAPVGFVGARRNEETRLPDPYLNTVPEGLDGRRVLILDPMLATGGSLIHTLELAREAGAGRITVACVLAAPEGLATVEAAGWDVRVFTASIDERLNEVAFIHPGLGDAGDRQFGVA